MKTEKPTTTDPGAAPEDFGDVPLPPGTVTPATAISWFKRVAPDLRSNLALIHADSMIEAIDEDMRRITSNLPTRADKPAKWHNLLRARRELQKARDHYRLALGDVRRALRSR